MGWALEGKVLKHKILAIDEANIIQLISPDNVPQGCHFKFNSLERIGINVVDLMDLRFADFTILYYKAYVSPKPNPESPELEPVTIYSFIITYDNSLEESQLKNQYLAANLNSRVSARYKRCQKVVDEMPVLVSPCKKSWDLYLVIKNIVCDRSIPEKEFFLCL